MWRIAMLMLLAASGAALAQTERIIHLHSQDAEPIAVGTLEVAEDGHFTVRWDESLFSDHFLSMRPFRCLEGPEKLWCRSPYPYDNPRMLSNLTDLEYELIFVWKPKGEYGINMWNGVYYRLEDAQGRISGVLNEMNLDILASPPESPDERLIGEYDLEPGDPDSHWLPRITID